MRRDLSLSPQEEVGLLSGYCQAYFSVVAQGELWFIYIPCKWPAFWKNNIFLRKIVSTWASGFCSCNKGKAIKFGVQDLKQHEGVKFPILFSTLVSDPVYILLGIEYFWLT